VPRALLRPTRRPVLAAAAAVLTLTLAACGGTETTLDERAHWSQADLPPSAQLAGEGVTFAGALGATGDLPALVAGTGADPGAPAHARAWTDAGENGWRWKELPLPDGAEAHVEFAVTDGTTTWIAGTTWTAGERVAPFVVSSSDRREWTRVELPGDVTDAAVRPGAAALMDGAPLVVGMDAEDLPVAFSAGADGELVSLPAAPDDREFHGFRGAAVLGDTVVAVGSAVVPGQTAETVVYRSDDGGASWTVDMGPAEGPADLTGVVATPGGFVVTGYLWGTDGVAGPAAWSSVDGATWTAETLPTLDQDRDGVAVSEGDSAWLDAPAVSGDRVVAPLVVRSALRLAVVQRDPSGAWSVLGDTNDWELPGVGAETAFNEDGSVLLAQAERNVGRVGQISVEGGWTADGATFGTHDYGMQFATFLDPAGSPALIGRRPVMETFGRGGWRQTGQLANYVLEGAALTERPWDPAETAGLSDIVGASQPDGPTVLLGVQVIEGDQGTTTDIVGWYRAAPDAPPAPVGGFASPEADFINAVTFAGGTWVATGSTRASFSSITPDVATVWTSSDGLSWGRATGPFAAAAGGKSWASGACALPGGDLLAVGHTEEGAQDRPVAWRLTGGQWQRLDASAFGAEFGSLSSCTTEGDTTVVQGETGDRATVWRTSDGASFESTTLGKRGEAFGTIRLIDGGYAAAGTRASKGQQGAVIWLSKDATTWRAVPVPSERVLTGADVMPDGSGGLVVAANSGSSPEVWVLANPEDLFEEA
jgi:hypothetical protein